MSIQETIRAKVDGIGRNKAILITLLAGLLVFGAYTVFAEEEPMSETVAFCEEVASEIETDSVLAGPETSCDCIPPGTFDEAQYTAGEHVDNRTELFLVRCETDLYDTPFIQPVRVVVDEDGTIDEDETSDPTVSE